MIQYFFREGTFTKALNHMHVALIQKTSGATKVAQFRPIALCNVAYKIISKLLAGRLKTLLGKTMSKPDGFCPRENNF